MKKTFSAQFQHPLDKDDSIVLTINTKGGVPNGPRTRVWYRDKNGVYLQIGLIKNLKIELDSNEYHAKVETSVVILNNEISPKLKKILIKNEKILTKHGIKVKGGRLKSFTYNPTEIAAQKK